MFLKRFELILVFLFAAGHKWIISIRDLPSSTKEEVAGECRKTDCIQRVIARCKVAPCVDRDRKRQNPKMSSVLRSEVFHLRTSFDFGRIVKLHALVHPAFYPTSTT